MILHRKKRMAGSATALPVFICPDTYRHPKQAGKGGGSHADD